MRGEDITIREMEPGDASSIAALCGELGYPSTAEAMRLRMSEVSAVANHAVLVACVAETLVGWIDLGIVHHLHTAPYGEIGGFVVSGEWRSSGIGRTLLKQAEAWMRERGVKRALVRSRITRERAHRFYLREGYLQAKTSAVFEKDIGPAQLGR